MPPAKGIKRHLGTQPERRLQELGDRPIAVRDTVEKNILGARSSVPGRRPWRRYTARHRSRLDRRRHPRCRSAGCHLRNQSTGMPLRAVHLRRPHMRRSVFVNAAKTTSAVSRHVVTGNLTAMTTAGSTGRQVRRPQLQAVRPHPCWWRPAMPGRRPSGRHRAAAGWYHCLVTAGRRPAPAGNLSFAAVIPNPHRACRVPIGSARAPIGVWRDAFLFRGPSRELFRAPLKSLPPGWKVPLPFDEYPLPIRRPPADVHCPSGPTRGPRCARPRHQPAGCHCGASISATSTRRRPATSPTDAPCPAWRSACRVPRSAGAAGPR